MCPPFSKLLISLSVFVFVTVLAAGKLFGQAPEPPQVQYWAGHEAPLYAVAYSPDGKNVISASVDGSIRVWDRATGNSIRRMAVHRGPVLSLAIAPDGLTFASGGRDGRITWWDLARWHPLVDIAGVPGAPTALIAGADGNTALTGDQANIVRLWDFATKTAVRDFPGAAGGITAVAFDAPNKLVVAASGDGVIRAWNLDNAQLQAVLSSGPSNAVSLSPDGKSLVIGGQDGVVRLAMWPLVPPANLVTHNDQAIAAAWSRDGQWVATAGLDQQIHLVQAADSKLLRSLTGQPSKPTSVAVSADSKLVATGSDTGVLKFWQSADGADRGVVAGHVGAITALAWDSAAERLATSGADGTVRIWTVPAAPAKWGTHAGAAERLATTSDATVAASIGADKTVRIWNSGTGQPLRVVEGLPQLATAVAVGPKGVRLAWGDATGAIVQQNVADGADSVTLGAHSAAVTGLVFDSAGKSLVSAGADGLVKIWNLPLTGPRSTPPLPAVAERLAALSAEQVVATAGTAEPYVFDVVKGQVVRKFAGHSGTASALAIRSDLPLAAVGSSDGTVRIWDPRDGVEQGVVAADALPVTAVAINPKERQIATAAVDGLIRMWRFPEQPVALVARPAAAGAAVKSRPLAATLDGQLVAVGQADGSVQLYRDRTLQAAQKIGSGTTAATGLAFRRDAQELAAADALGQLTTWNLGDAAEVGSVVAHEGPITSVGYSAAGDRIMTTGTDGMVRFWQTPLVSSQSVAKAAAPWSGMTLAPDGARAYLLAGNRAVKAVDTTTGGEIFGLDAWPAQPVSVAVTPGGDVLAVGDEQGVVRLRMATNGAERGAFGGHTGAVRALAFNPKRPHLATAGDDGRVRVWELPPPPVALNGHQARIGALALSPNGQMLATGSADKSARLWNLANGTVAWLLGDAANVTCAAWKPDGAQVVTGNAARQVRVWNVADGQQLALLEGHAAAITHVAFLPDGTLVSAAADGQIKVWNVAEKKELAALAGPAKQLAGLVVLPSVMQVVAVGADGSLRSWNLVDKKPLADVPANMATSCLAASPDGRLLALGGPDKTVRLLTSAGGAAGGPLAGARDAIVAVAFSADSQRVAAASLDGEVRVYTTGGQLQESVALQPLQPTTLAFAADGKGLLVGASDHQIHSVRLAWQKTIEVSPQGIQAIGFLPDGDSLLVAGRDKSLAIWNVVSGAAVRNLAGATDAQAAVAVSPDGNRLAAAGADKTLRVWNTADGAIVATSPLPAPGRDIKFSRDGMKLAVALEDGGARVVETANGRVWQRWQDQKQGVVSVAWSADPRVFFTAAADGSLRRLTLNAALVLAPEGGFVGAALVPSGQAFATFANDKVGRLWTVAGQAGPQLAGAEAPLVGLAVRADGAQIAGISADKHLYLWTAGNGQLERKVSLGVVPNSVSYSGDNTRLLVACGDGGVRLVQAADGRIAETVFQGGGAAAGALLLPPPAPQPNQPPPGERVLVASTDGKVVVRGAALLRMLAGHQGAVTELVWTPDGGMLCSAGTDKTVRQWNAANGQVVRNLGGPTDVLTGLAIVAGGTRVVGASLDKNLRWWNVADGALLATVPQPVPFRNLAAAPAADAFFTAGDDGSVRLWDATLMKELERWTLPGAPGPLVSGAARTALIVAADRSLKVCDSSVARAIVADAAAVQGLALSGDGQQIITSGNDALIKVFDREGKLVRQLGGSPTAWRSLAVLPDGPQLVAAADPARQQPGVFRWNLTSGQQLPTVTLPAPITSLGLVGSERVAVSTTDAKLRTYAASDLRLLEEVTAPAAVAAVGTSADGAKVLFASADGAVSAWQPSLVRMLTGHEGVVSGVVWAAGGRELITCGADKTVRRWDSATGKQVGTFAGNVAAVAPLAISDDGHVVATSAADNVARIWRIPSRAADAVANDVPVTWALPAATAAIRTLRLSRDGSVLAVGGDDALVRLWDVATGKLRESLAGHAGAVHAVALSPDGQQVVSAGADRTVRRWTPAVRTSASEHEGAVVESRFAADGKTVLTAGADKRVRRLAAADLKPVHDFAGTTAPVRAAALSTDGEFTVAAGDDAVLRVWRTADAQAVADLKLPAAVTCLAVGRKASRIVAGGADGIVRTLTLNAVAKPPQVELLQEGRGHTASVTRVSLTADERFVVSVGADQTVRKWLTPGPAPRADLASHAGAVYGLAFHPTGPWLVSGGGDRTVRGWRLPEGQPAFEAREHPSAVHSVAFDAAGKRIVSGGADGTVRTWDESGQPGGAIAADGPGRWNTVGFSPDGSALLAAGTSRGIQFWQAASLEPVRKLEGHNDAVYQVAYNKAGNRLASLDYSGQLVIWDSATGNALYHQQLPVAQATGLAYAPDGTEVAVASRDPRVVRVIIPPAAR